jgi:SAM-dependent methyltransferase
VLEEAVGTGRRDIRIFDVGCGAGEMLDILTAYGRVGAIDMSDKAVSYCRDRLGDAVDVNVGRIPDDLPPAGSMDLITAFDVIEHIDDDVGALKAIHNALRPGGLFVCTVPAFQFLWSHHDEVNHHKRRYRAPLLRERLENAGYRIDHLSYFNTWLFPVAAAARLAQRVRPSADDSGSDLSMPPGPVNEILTRLFASERHVVRRHRLPFGVSLVAVART